MPDNGLTYRSFATRKDGPETLNDEARTVEVIGATETPVEVFDYDRYERVNEVLLMSGCELPENRQVPLLDAHSRWDARDVLGSFREMRTADGRLLGTAAFSSAPESQAPWTKVREGHLTDFSIGYTVLESVWVPENVPTTIDGRTFAGPMRVTTRWRVKELSVVPIGADQFAKARSEFQRQEQKPNAEGENTMDKIKPEGTEVERSVQQPEGSQQPAAVPVDAEKIRAEAKEAARAATVAERSRVREINDICARFDCGDLAGELIDTDATVDQARAKVMDALAARESDTAYRAPVQMGADAKDKFRAAAEHSLLLREGGIYVPEKVAPGAEELRGYSLRELARECLRTAGKPTGGDLMQMLGRAMVTDDFPYILANVAHKSLFLGWEGAAETWQKWCATGSVTDFKTHYSPRVSESSDLEEVPEEGEYKYGKRTEAQESYAIATYGKIFAVSRQLIINDDLGAITSQNFGRGEAAARKIGDIAYAVLTANAAMGDGVALFHNATHGNLAGSGGAPGVATIAAAELAMGTQKDLQELRRLNIRPVFYLAPLALKGLSEVFFKTEKFSDSDTVATDSSLASTRTNIYSGDVFTRIYEPRLDDDSPAAWYLAAAKGKTVTVFFLNGMQKPYLDTKQGWNVDGVEYKVRIDAGAKALDWRGLYKNAGT